MPLSSTHPIISDLEKKIEAFENNHPLNHSSCDLGDKKSHYFYIHKKKISKSLKLSIKQQLKKVFELPHYTGLQVIGDSASFDRKASTFVQNKLLTTLQNFEGLIFYGFTGEGANGIIADLLEKGLSSDHIIANIVANESLDVINNYNCRYSTRITNFLIVGNGKGRCKFGDDIELSDQLAEQLICLEGGAISFCQLINSLIYHAPAKITIYTGLRNQENTYSRPLFSAGELLLKFQSATTIQEMEITLSDYLKNHRFNLKNNNENEAKQKKIKAHFEKLKSLEKSKQKQILETMKKIEPIFFQNEGTKENSHLTTYFFPTPKR